MAKNKDGGGGGEGAIGGGAAARGHLVRQPQPVRTERGRKREREGVREAEGEAGRDGGREAYPHLIQLTGAIWQLLAR